jgi:hypothetical protein
MRHQDSIKEWQQQEADDRKEKQTIEIGKVDD